MNPDEFECNEIHAGAQIMNARLYAWSDSTEAIAPQIDLIIAQYSGFKQMIKQQRTLLWRLQYIHE